MTLREIVDSMRPGFRIRISELYATGEEERRIWTPTLSDAQIIANADALRLREAAAAEG